MPVSSDVVHRIDGGGPRTVTRLATRWTSPVARLSGLALVAAVGAVAALLTPKGPITVAQALTTMAATMLVGTVAGFSMGRRWTTLLAPVLFILAFELVRLPMEGPLVDWIAPGGMLATFALVLGRGVHGVLAVFPLMVGTVVGVHAAGRLGRRQAPTVGVAGRIAVSASLVVLVAIVWALAIPARTAPIVGADGGPQDGSIAEISTVTIGGHEQTLMIRGRSVDNPVLLYLNGGPGGTDLGAMRLDTELEQDFVVVTWEQRGAGHSYPSLEPVDTFTLDSFVDDTIELTNHLRERFDEDAIFLVGNSWGTTLGVLAAQQHPELYRAYVGAGQMVSQRETDIMFWEDALAWAESSGRDDLASQLRRNGPPPYDEVLRYDPVVSTEHDWNAYPGFDGSNEMPVILFVPEYAWMDRINAFRGFLDSNWYLYPQLQSIDFRTDVPSLDVPTFMVTGQHEARGRAVLAEEWFAMLDAPIKEATVFEAAGHRPHFDDPHAFAEFMRHVRSVASP